VAAEAWGFWVALGHHSAEWGRGMVKDKTLVPWGTTPMWMLWLGWGGSEYRFTWGRGSQVRNRANSPSTQDINKHTR
jgi:hypothetical protein